MHVTVHVLDKYITEQNRTDATAAVIVSQGTVTDPIWLKKNPETILIKPYKLYWRYCTTAYVSFL